jgi:cell division ATPase FtsA
VTEILQTIKQKIEESIFKNDFAKSPVIITGGGSRLIGIRDFAGEILNRRIKLRNADNYHREDRGTDNNNDCFTAEGMIKFARLKVSDESNRTRFGDFKETPGLFRKTMLWIENNL